MAQAIAKILPTWENFLKNESTVGSMPGVNSLAVLIYTDQVQVHRFNETCWCSWLAERCRENVAGDLLEARLFSQDAEIFLRREDEGRWLCRLVNDNEPGDGAITLFARVDREVYIWGERLKESSDWYEERMRPIKLPLENGGDLAVASIAIYQREEGLPVWRFIGLKTKGVV